MKVGFKRHNGGHIRYSEKDIVHGALITYDESEGILTWFEDHQAMGAFWLGEQTGGHYTPVTSDGGGEVPVDAEFWSKSSWCTDELLTKLEPPMSTKGEVEVWMMCNPGFEKEICKIYKHLF